MAARALAGRAGPGKLWQDRDPKFKVGGVRRTESASRESGKAALLRSAAELQAKGGGINRIRVTNHV